MHSTYLHRTSVRKTENQIFLILAITAACQAFFAAFPTVDLAVSGLFYRANVGFPLAGNEVILMVRAVCNLIISGLAIVSLGMFLLAITGLYQTRIPKRVWGFISVLYTLGPVILVNGLLKANSGRARPAHVGEFGGDSFFTPAFEFTDQCLRNCSFVSGEAAGSTAFLISALLLTAFLRPGRLRLSLRSIATVIAVTCTVFRIMLGRHFLSDVIFAILFVSLIALALTWLLRRAFEIRRQAALRAREAISVGCAV